MTSPTAVPSARRATMGFIFVTVLIDMIGLGLIVPSLPGIMRRFFTDETTVSQYFGVFVSLYALMQFLASPLLGTLSDIFGRRPVLLNSIALAAVDYLLMGFAPTLWLLFVGRIVSGLTGANMTVAMAYIADVSPPEKRAQNFGMVGAAFGLGFIIGPAIGGLLGDLGPSAPFLFAAGLNAVNLLFGFFVLPESLPRARRSVFSMSRISPFRFVRQAATHPALIGLLAVHFLFQLAGQTHPAIWTLYTQGRFGWSIREVGLSLAAVGLISTISQGFLTRLIIPRLGEIKTVSICALGYAAAFAGFGMATQGWMMYAVLLISGPSWVLGPALQALVSKQANEDRQGEVQGILFGLSSLASIMTPLIATQLFAFFTAPNHPHIPGAPYLFAATASLVGWIFFLRARHRITTI